jgi:signal transduction histidine kinase
MTIKKATVIIMIMLSLALMMLIISYAGNIRVLSFIAAALITALIIFVLILMRNNDKTENEIDKLSIDDTSIPQEEKMAYIGTVAAGLAHEIRNPLNAIDFNIRMIQEDFESGDWDKNDITNRFKSTYKEIKHLERLVNDFLLYARKKALQIGQTDPLLLLESVKVMLAETAEMHKISISIISGETPKIEADGEVLKQALFNIAKNGIEAMNDGGTLEMMVEFNPEKDILRMKIRDNGNGIQPHDLKKIFHLFYSTRRSGTGIGLPVAKSIIENHNGWIEVESKPGKGTTFDIYLPRKQKEGPDDGK